MKCNLGKNIAAVAILVMGLAIVFASCSARKNTAATRNYQAFITRYNIYYNGDTHYKETLKEMETKYEDDYTRLLFVHPAEAKNDPKAPQPQGNFDRSIEKAQKAIQLRSIKKAPARKAGKNSDPAYKAWLKRDEYNPFLHNAWMMMGRSQFLNGDFLGAASTFFYISKHFTWLPKTVTEAKLWQARSYCALDWLFEAEMIITRIKPDELTDNNLKSLYNSTYADFYIKSREYDKAIPYLRDAVSLASGTQKTRLNFLLGQVYTLVGDKERAYAAFGKAGGSSSATYRTKFNARIKQSEVYTGANIEPEVKALKRMTRYDRNKEYLDQIYYAIGNLYLSRRDTAHAIENYVIAAEKSTRNGIDRAISQVTLGGLYYDLHEYDKAQPCYSEAIPLLPESYPDYRMLKRRSDVLDELAVYSQNVTLQDSLLKLSYMTPEEQLKVVEKIIEELKKKEKEDAEAARREEYLAQQAANGSDMNNSNAPTTFTMNGDNSWYFYNSSTVNAGKTEFQRRWGSRKLEDDWRRRNKASFSFDDFGGNESSEDSDSDDAESTEATGGELTDEQKEKSEHENDPHYPEYYLKQIPADDEQRQVSNDIIQEGLYNMGVILKDKMEDFGASKSEFERLLTRYPDNIYRLDVYYNLYLMFMRLGDTSAAERYRNMILTDFPDSKYGQAMHDPDYLENLRTMDERQEKLYAETYEAYLDDRNADVHRGYETFAEQFPLSKIMPKFMFLHALAYVTENNPEEFRNVLNEMLERYPDTDLAPFASSYLKGLAQGKKLHAGTSNMRGFVWDIRLSNDSTVSEAMTEAQFELNPEDRQLLVLLYPTDTVAPNRLLYDIARHNFSTFVVKDFDLEQMNFGQLGILVIKGFDNLNELKHYRSLMETDAELNLPRQVRPVIISENNFDILLREGRSFEEYFNYVRDKTYQDTEESVLPPDFFITSDEEIEEKDPVAEPVEEHVDIEPEPMVEPVVEPIADPAAEPVTDPAAEPVAEPVVEPIVEPTVQPEVEPVQPAVTGTPPAPVVKPETKPQPEPESPVSKPAPKPVAKPAKPVPPTKNLPEYPAGSEGDDPLFD